MSGQIKLKAASLGGDITLTPTDTASNLVVTIPATTGSAVVSTTALAYSPFVGFRNRIINGGMTIDQRNAGAAVTANGTYPVDRFLIGNGTDGAFSAQRDTVAPSGFINSLKVTTTTADATLTTTQGLLAAHYIEGLNVADLAWGTASAQPVTLSFWVRSSLTGTFGGSLQNSALDRSYPFTYTISSANTYEYKTITVPGDTSGTWLTTNGIGLRLWFGLGVGPDRSGTAGAWSGSDLRSVTGAVSVIGTLSATWFITGVQLEKGSTATPFEFRSIGQELALCQRYYYRLNGNASAPRAGAGFNATTTLADYVFSFPVQMRIDITALEQSGTASDYNITHGGTNTNCSSVPTYLSGSKDTIGFRFTVASGLTAGQGSLARLLNANAFLGLSAEL
jgi:hypothetical protein